MHPAWRAQNAAMAEATPNDMTFRTSGMAPSPAGVNPACRGDSRPARRRQAGRGRSPRLRLPEVRRQHDAPAALVPTQRHGVAEPYLSALARPRQRDVGHGALAVLLAGADVDGVRLEPQR